eukprot:10673-Alexandrium_andersonii.AAC.1
MQVAAWPDMCVITLSNSAGIGDAPGSCFPRSRVHCVCSRSPLSDCGCSEAAPKPRTADHQHAFGQPGGGARGCFRCFRKENAGQR